MKSLKFSILVLLLIFVSTFISAQDKKQQSLNDGTIQDQFEFVIKKSSNWRDERGQSYEVIKRNWILNLKVNTLDSLKAIQTKLIDTRDVVNKQQKEIDGLKTNLSKTQDTLLTTNEEKDSMALFGLQMSKTSYNLLMWLIIIALLVLLILFIYKFNSSNSVTRIARNNLTDIEEEFEEYRTNALEREQKVRRQLQDELNKQKRTK
ncbi:tRNA (guanine-N1)-methyltransferase [Flavobacteriaceae bacterium AH-315-B10]|nr:tRNA (guanine-N1)-methyltransferase [Flavobacteriaceae bacterium AH-315-B10]